MWPLISLHEGDWFPAGLSSRDFRGLFGYKVGWGLGVQGLGSEKPTLSAPSPEPAFAPKTQRTA